MHPEDPEGDVDASGHALHDVAPPFGLKVFAGHAMQWVVS